MSIVRGGCYQICFCESCDCCLSEKTGLLWVRTYVCDQFTGFFSFVCVCVCVCVHACMCERHVMAPKCRDVRTREVGIQEIHHKVKPYEVGRICLALMCVLVCGNFVCCL